jgi:hypothetical protein
MRSVFAAIITLLLGAGSAAAADSTSARLAETGAFLLGHAYRCGVPVARVSHAAKVIQDMIVAAADDASEEKAATSRFSAIFLAAAYPDRNGDGLVPECKAVVTQFERLEQHHQQAGLN